MVANTSFRQIYEKFLFTKRRRRRRRRTKRKETFSLRNLLFICWLSKRFGGCENLLILFRLLCKQCFFHSMKLLKIKRKINFSYGHSFVRLLFLFLFLFNLTNWINLQYKWFAIIKLKQFKPLTNSLSFRKKEFI